MSPLPKKCYYGEKENYVKVKKTGRWKTFNFEDKIKRK